MNPQHNHTSRRILRFALFVLATGLVSSGGLAHADAPEAELTWEFKQELFRPVEAWIEELEEEKNADGQTYKLAKMSRIPLEVDDERYTISVHVNTAEGNQQVTERYTLTLERDGSGWTIASKELADTYVGLYRDSGIKCYPFKKFSFDREGLTLAAKDGSMCEIFFEGGVSLFGVHADGMTQRFAPPEHAKLLHVGQDYHSLHQLYSRDHMKELFFKPALALIQGDAESCEELITESFEGLERIAPEERAAVAFDENDESISSWAKPLIKDTFKDRKGNPFSGFRPLNQPGRRNYSVFLPRDMEMDSGVYLSYDNWGGWEVQFGVAPKRFDLPNQLIGSIYGSYTEETLKNNDAYELERREDSQNRWFRVNSVKGQVDLATEEEEKLEADIVFGLTLKQDLTELPFFIVSNRSRGALGGNRPAPLDVNSVQLDGKELTWVRTGPISGRVILPEKLEAGSEIELRMAFGSRAIIKFTRSYSYVNREGWIPFVRIGDAIGEFELTLRSPAEYTILGVGRKTDERVEGDTRISHWKAEFPVTFPTMIFGKYRTDAAEFDALKADGKTVIPVHISVDEDSFSQWDIRESNLRPIAEQAVNAINLYTAISGLEYPFGELNLVNDPVGQFLYGQSPSSIVYLGSGVFWSEGKLAPMFRDSTSIARFKRSVTAHEVAHQWWLGIVSHANQRNYWFAESLAEYFSALYLEVAFGYDDYLKQVDEWRRNIYSSRLKSNVQNATSLFAGEWGGGVGETDGYTAAVYNKGPYAFHMLRETFRDPTIEERGPEGADARFFTFLKLFCRDLAEKREIVTLDIQRAAESGLGGVDQNGERVNVDLGWFFDQWIRGSGIPKYEFEYDVRQTEDGAYMVDGMIRQRVVVGSGKSVVELPGRVYKGILYVTAKSKAGSTKQRVIVTAAETPFQFKVPKKPFEVVLNDDGEMLALAVNSR